ncbi:MAG: helix-turn-helix domain containing protein [Propionibacteriales bacterium]|nr:helix-turn-helix domain containing protein [Propionibacteriales bacterium]
MPRNRRPQDREEKRAEIVAAATTLFTESGFDQTSLSKVASAAGVTTTTIYWYFADKDALLVAVLDDVLDTALAEAALEPERPWAEQVLWAVDRLERFERLVTVVHARAATAEAVGAWHDSFHTLMDAMMVEGYRGAGVPEADLVPMTRISAFVVEGLMTHPQTEHDRRAVIELLTRPR